MNPRLFVGNLELEHLLADAGYQPSLKIRRLNAELAACWLSVADDGDYLWCPQAIPLEFFEQMRSQGLPHVVPVTKFSQVPAGIELVPWGWTDAWMQSAWKHRWSFSAPEPAIVRDVNSRRFSFDLESEWQIGLPGAAAIRDLTQLESAWHRAVEFSPRAVIKANWGMSARERILVDGAPTEAQRSWVRKRLAEQGVVFLEPWLAREEEIGVQIQIPPQGPPNLVGISSLVCDGSGQYRGSWCTARPDAGADFPQRWQPAVEFALQAAERMQQQGYFGPVGIDALRYRLADGALGIRPLQDINARWTMGRLSLGWRRLLRPNQAGFWQHGPREDWDQSLPELSNPVRILETSPLQIADEPVEHRTRLLIFEC